MGRRIVCGLVLLAMLFPCWTLRAAEVSESTRLMEAQGTPYPPQKDYAYPNEFAIMIDLLVGGPQVWRRSHWVSAWRSLRRPSRCRAGRPSLYIMRYLWASRSFRDYEAPGRLLKEVKWYAIR